MPDLTANYGTPFEFIAFFRYFHKFLTTIHVVICLRLYNYEKISANQINTKFYIHFYLLFLSSSILYICKLSRVQQYIKNVRSRKYASFGKVRNWSFNFMAFFRSQIYDLTLDFISFFKNNNSKNIKTHILTKHSQSVCLINCKLWNSP